MTYATPRPRLIPDMRPADWMRKAREAAGLDQEQLAELIGVSRQTISNTERGVSQPRRILVNAWSLATGVPVEWLLTGRVSDPPDGPSDVPPAGFEPATHGLELRQLRVTDIGRVRARRRYHEMLPAGWTLRTVDILSSDSVAAAG